jgi:hypothetical protein
MAVEAARKYSEYVDAVSKGSRVTGISVESMSKLKFAAEAAHTSYEALTQGLTRFASNVVKAAQGSEAQAKAFTALGISHEQLVAGEKDLNGLLMVVADKFQTLGRGCCRRRRLASCSRAAVRRWYRCWLKGARGSARWERRRRSWAW